MYKIFIRPILFLFQPETIHSIVFTCLKISRYIPFAQFFIRKIFVNKNYVTEIELFGIKFPNVIGLAAGLDKEAEVYDVLGNLGFGHIEIGTVTPKAQPGNQKPRCFRLKRNEALINRMGFNNSGVYSIVNNLKRFKHNVIIGGNIGKNKLTANEDAISDYITNFNELFEFVDYFIVNVSSPNTPNLRELQDKEPLTKLLLRLQELNHEKTHPKPILLKIAPDLTFVQIDDIIEIVNNSKISGIVATNTTIARDGLAYSDEYINKIGAGGLSGKPLQKKSTEIIKYISEKSNGTIPIIGVGGIMNENDAIEKLEAGASLVQLYTGFIYEGPALIKKINKAIFEHRKKH